MVKQITKFKKKNQITKKKQITQNIRDNFLERNNPCNFEQNGKTKTTTWR